MCHLYITSTAGRISPIGRSTHGVEHDSPDLPPPLASGGGPGGPQPGRQKNPGRPVRGGFLPGWRGGDEGLQGASPSRPRTRALCPPHRPRGPRHRRDHLAGSPGGPVKLRAEGGLLYVSAELVYRSQKLALSEVILDTGSTGTLFSADEASRLGLIPELNDPIRQIGRAHV